MSWMSPLSAPAEPVRIAPLVFIYWADSPAPAIPPGAVALAIRPSAAFGDGSHPTTRLCARAMDFWCRARPIHAVLDVGTGSGILARLARAHGVRVVVGTDSDPKALAAARVNAALDDDQSELLLSGKSPDTWGPRFDLVVANILEGVLVDLADSLVAALAPGGRLLLSGFTPLQTPALRATFISKALALETQAYQEGWSLLQFRHLGIQ